MIIIKDKIKILNKKLSELINFITENKIEKRKQIIKEIVDNGFYGLELEKSKKLSNILTEIKENINTIDEKEKRIFIGKLSNFKFSINKAIKNILIFILLLFIVEGYLFLYVQTDQSALIGGIIIGITVPLIYIYMYFFTDRFKKNTTKSIDTDIIINKEKNILINEIQKKETTIEKNIKLVPQILKLIIGIICIYIAYSIMKPLIESHGFNGLMILIHPGLWGVIVGPILIINGIYNTIFYILIKENIFSKEKIIPIKNIIGYFVLGIIPMFYFIVGIKMTFSDNPFGGIYNFPFISLAILIYIGLQVRKNIILLKNNYENKRYN